MVFLIPIIWLLDNILLRKESLDVYQDVTYLEKEPEDALDELKVSPWT